MLNIFTWFSNRYDTVLTAGVSHVIASLLGAVAGELIAAATLAIVIAAFLMMFRQLDVWAGLAVMGRIACISILLTAAGFSQWISTPFLTTIPNWIAQVVNGASGAQAGAQQFDNLWSAVQHMDAALLQLATGWSGMTYTIAAAFITTMIGIALAVCFLVWEFARLMVGVIVCALPVVLICYLFAYTRPVTDRALGVIFGLLLLQLLISVLLQVLVASDTAFMVYAQANAGAQPSELLSALMSVLMFFSMGAVLIVFLPSKAAHIGGGISFNVRPIMAVPMSWFRK